MGRDFRYAASGIASVLIKDVSVDLPWDLTPPDQWHVVKPHLYRPKHEPCDDNYAHSAIAVFKDGKRVTKSAQIGGIAKREFRQLFSDRAIILFRPIS